MENIDPSEIRPRPLQHTALPPGLEEMARHSYRIVGRLMFPTFEQWELEFLRDGNPRHEVCLWVVIAEAYQMATKERPDLDEYQVLGDLVAVSAGAEGKLGLDGVYKAACNRLGWSTEP